MNYYTYIYIYTVMVPYFKFFCLNSSPAYGCTCRASCLKFERHVEELVKHVYRYIM